MEKEFKGECKGWYWQGSWANPIKRTAAIYYK